MIKTVIVDDEEESIDSLRLLLSEYCKDITVVGTANSISSGVQQIDSLNPDLVFLDVEMPFGTGFELLEKIQKVNFQIIFITAYSQYAISAIRCNALDYLLKPIDVDELINAVDKLNYENSSNERVESLISSYSDPKRPLKIALHSEGAYSLVRMDSIIRCEAKVNYTTFFIENTKPITVARTLKEFEKLLPDDKFMRVHQSHLINVDKVEKYYKTDGGYLLMSDCSTVIIARSKRADVVKYFLG